MPGAVLGEQFEVVGGDFDSPENRASARGQLISVSISMEDLFGIPFSGPPYQLAPIAREQLAGDEDDAIEASFAMNCYCMSCCSARGFVMHVRATWKCGMLGGGSSGHC